MLYISSNEVVVRTQRCRILKAGNTQLHRDILLHQPTLYISCREANVCIETAELRKLEIKPLTSMNFCCAPPNGAAPPSTLGRKGDGNNNPRIKDYIITELRTKYPWLHC